MRLVQGQTLSSYEILDSLGAGAMGEVYRARDTRLDRDVAIKVLSGRLIDDAESLQRFEREARSLARLNHPNVAQIHSVEQADGLHFLVLELVPGQTLQERIADGPLPVEEAVDVCRQVAEGLEAAHEAGVIHRDLKPANIHLTPEHRAKVLDFGLAKRSLDGGAASTTGSVLSTQEGHLLGTPLYMAPEQARGKPADKRVDVWAFGCVLYESLTGQQPFRGESLSDVLAAILEKTPEWSRLPTGTPARVRRLLERCLEKDPRSRLRDIGEARIALERADEVQAPQPVPADAQRRGVSLRALVLTGLVLLGLGVGVGRLGFRPTSSRAPSEVRELRLTEMLGVEETPAVSPDGKKVVFVSRVDGKQQIFVRLLETGSWRPLTSREADHSFPRWANDHTLVFFVHSGGPDSPGALWRTDYLGSSAPERFLDSVEAEADVDRAGRRVATFRAASAGTELVILDYARAGTEAVHPLPAARYGSPRWSPDGERIAFELRQGLHQNEIRVIDVASGSTETVARVAGQTRGLAWLPDGSGLVYSSSKGSTLPYPPLFRLRVVDLASGRDVPLPYGGSGNMSYVQPDITLDGKLVASRVVMEADIFKFPVAGTPVENVENAVRVTRQTGVVQVPSASPDGESVAYLSDSGGHANIWIARVDGSERPRRITNEQDPRTIIGVPLWSPRGDWITYWKGPPGRPSEQWLIRPDGSDEHVLVPAVGGASWAADGEWLYYMALHGDIGSPLVEKIPVAGGEPVPVRERAGGILVTSDGTTGYFSPTVLRQGEIWRVSPIATGAPEVLVDGLQSRIPLWPHHYALSYDDEWLATPLLDDATTNLWRISTRTGAESQVTDFGRRATIIGRQVSWSRDGESIFAAVMEIDADIVLIEGLFE